MTQIVFYGTLMLVDENNSEGCLRGRKEPPAKRLRVHALRGFESHPFRHLDKLLSIFFGLVEFFRSSPSKLARRTAHLVSTKEYRGSLIVFHLFLFWHYFTSNGNINSITNWSDSIDILDSSGIINLC